MKQQPCASGFLNRSTTRGRHTGASSGSGAIHCFHDPTGVNKVFIEEGIMVCGYISVMKICHLLPGCLANYIFSAPPKYSDQML